MNKQNCLLCFYVLVMSFIVVLPLKATTLEELLTNEQLNISIRLQTTGKILAKQAVVFEIEISTPHWFAKGTKFDPPQIADTVILPANQFAINSTKRVKGITWASQLRELTLYPLKEGRYQIPPIDVFVSIKTAASGAIEGKLFTPQLSFSVDVPTALKQVDHYTVSTDFQISIKGEFNEDQSYSIGDAVTQVITFNADDIPAMMLPRYTKPALNGVSIYHKPAQLQDRISRGTLTGMRTESFTYIFERPGEYFIPEQNFYWWSLTSNTLLSERVPSQHWLVTGTKEQGSDPTDENQWGKTKLFSIIALGVFSLFILFFLAYFKQANRLKTNKNSRCKKNHKEHYRAYIKAIKQKQYQLACKHLYKIYDINTNHYKTLRYCFNQQKKKQKLLEKLLQLAYQNNHNDIILLLDEAKSLLPSKDSKKVHLNKNIKHIRLNTYI